VSQRATVLQALTDAGARGVTNGEFIYGLRITRFAARILELREQGYVIETRREGDGKFRFILLGEPENVSAPGRPSAASSRGAGSDASQPVAGVSPAGEGEGIPGQLSMVDVSFDETVPPLRPRFIDPDMGDAA
jgi:hypothetical protein